MNLATRAASRVAWIGLGGVLLFLTVFALWTAVSTHSATRQVRHERALSRAFTDARYAVEVEQSLERKYRLAPARAVREQFGAAATSLVGALDRARRRGNAKDRATVAQALADHRSYLRALQGMFAAPEEGGDRQHALAVGGARVERMLSRVKDEVDAAAKAHDAEAAARLRNLDRSQNRVLIATPISLGVGLLLLGAFGGILMVYRRRSEEATRAELSRLERSALTDSLTGLRNHRAFQEDIARESKRRDRHETSLSLVMFDVDGLKRINDTRGHEAGDEHLMAVAVCLRETGRDSDAVYRVGGDEFAVILAHENAWGAFGFAQRVREKLGLTAAARPITVTAGIAQAEGQLGEETLVRRADLALIEAKRSHRAALIYTQGIEPGVVERDEEAHQHHLQTLATALARAVDAKDSSTRSHCETVSELCSQIATELGLDDQRIAKLRLAGLLHDVGKIGVPDAILKKPARLTDEEFEIMKTHSTLGHRIVGGTELEEEAGWILHHHERVDGSGYPVGLSADQIPLESRIILVADAFEAITADRIYRRGRPESEALAELERHAGTQFDPTCVTALTRALGHDAPIVKDHQPA